jgi:hypothetical protein
MPKGRHGDAQGCDGGTAPFVVVPEGREPSRKRSFVARLGGAERNPSNGRELEQNDGLLRLLRSLLCILYAHTKCVAREEITMAGMLQILTYLLCFYLVIKGIEVLQIGLASGRESRMTVVAVGALTLIACIIAALSFANMQDNQADSIQNAMPSVPGAP